METGKLRHRIEIQKFTETRDAHGGTIKEYEELATVWAFVRPMTGRELVDGNQVEGQVDLQIEIRQRSDISTHHRIIHLSRTLEIISVRDENERHKKTIIHCREVAA